MKMHQQKMATTMRALTGLAIAMFCYTALLPWRLCACMVCVCRVELGKKHTSRERSLAATVHRELSCRRYDARDTDRVRMCSVRFRIGADFEIACCYLRRGAIELAVGDVERGMWTIINF